MENIKNVIELLSPAGSFDSFKAACSSRADAIYMGVSKFNARVMAENFDEEQYIECINYAHSKGIKVYLTLNTIMFDEDIKDALKLVLKLYSHGLDAVIVQDIGIAMGVRELLPNFPIHASTQMSVHTLDQVKYLEKIGFNRVVLARELTIDEIEYICKNIKLEIEVFVHGALCVSVSGQCLLSSQIGNRSANRGSCAQPCRMKYRLYNKTDKKLVHDNTYILSKKDIYGLEYLKRLFDAGVHSFKIEGRNKTPEYVSLVTSIYRKYLDNIKNELDINIDENDKKELTQIFNRNGLNNGYLEGTQYKDSITMLSAKNTGIYLGEIIDQKAMYVKLRLEEDIDMHDGIEIYSEESVVSTIVTCIKNSTGKIINGEIKKGEIVWLGDISKNIKLDSKIYKTSSSKLNEKYRKYINSKDDIKYKLNILVEIKKDKNINVVLKNDKINIISYIEYIPEIAKLKATTADLVRSSFEKTQDTLFEFENIEIDIDENIFVPVSKLNELRRDFVTKLEENFKVNIDISDISNNIDTFLNSKKEDILKIDNKKNIFKKENILFVYNYKDDVNYIDYYNEEYNLKLDRIYLNINTFVKYKENIFNKYKEKIDIYIYIPNFILSNLDKFLKENIEELVINGVKGFLVGNLGYMDKLIELKLKYKIKLVADYSLNISNIYSAIFLTKQGFDLIIPSVEIDKDMINEISKYIDLEIIDDYLTVMTSRYCILGSFVENRVKNTSCSMPCSKDKYFLKDSYNENYDIVCDNIDCVMKIVKKYESKQKIKRSVNIINCIV